MPYWRVKDLGFTGIAYPFRLDASGRVAVATAAGRTGRVDSLVQALPQLISTPKGSRFFNRSFGAKPLHILFSPNRPATLALWYHDLQELLEIWDPRIEPYGFSIVDQFESTAICRIGFRVRKTLLEGFVDAELPLE
ncbi:MAG: GPW/gp25 family protein [Candidatus Bipolaricaulaceae bacterium]